MYSTPILRLFEWTQWLNHPSKSLWGSMKQGGVLLPGKDKTPLTMESIPTISCSHSDIKVDGFRIKNPIFLLMTTYVDHCEGHGKMMEFKAALRCCSKEQADWKERNGKKSNPRRQGRPGSLRRLDGKDMSHGGNLACLEICQGSLETLSTWGCLNILSWDQYSLTGMEKVYDNSQASSSLCFGLGQLFLTTQLGPPSDPWPGQPHDLRGALRMSPREMDGGNGNPKK
nr:uncharacterized protein LOC116155353 isoform X1 [Camelus dromedarius]